MMFIQWRFIVLEQGCGLVQEKCYMAKQQKRPIAPPLTSDQQTLNDFTSVVQDNFKDLFSAAHSHGLRTTIPAFNEGQIGDISLVFIDPSYYIYAKVTSTAWMRIILS